MPTKPKSVSKSKARTKKVEILLDYHGLKVPKSPHLVEVIEKQLRAGRYEGPEVTGVAQIVKPEDRVLECGCGLGIVSGLAALKNRPEAVLSFEANPELIEWIRALHVANDLDMMEVRNELLMATPDRPKSVPFHLHENFLGSRLTEGGDYRETIEVKTAAFDDVKASFKPTVLVADIEGAELEFLRNADLAGIRAVVIEFHPIVYNVAGMRECKRILTQAGFQRLDCSTRTVWTMERAA